MYEPTQGQGTGSPLTNGLTGPVLVPLLQAGITGILTGLLAGVTVALLDIPVNPWGVFAVGTVGATLASWLAYRSRWQYVVEQVLGVDLNNDGFIGEPEIYTPPPIRVEVVQDNGNVLDILDIPHPEKVPFLASHIASGRSFSMDATANILSRDQFVDIRNELIGRGFAYWKVPGAEKQGVELTAAGRAIFKRISETYPPTLSAR